MKSTKELLSYYARTGRPIIIASISYDDMKALIRIQNTLHRMAETNCNYPRTERGEKAAETREKNLLIQAQVIATKYGLLAYHQGDPRGCALYLCTAEDIKTNQYNHGIACCE